MPAELLIGAAAEAEALPVGGGERRERQVMDCQRRKIAQDDEGHQRDAQPLTPCDGRLCRPDGQQVGAHRFSMADQCGQCVRLPLDVGVGEDQPMSSRGLSRLLTGPVLAGPARRQRRSTQHAQAWIAVGGGASGFGGAVGRSVVEHDDFEIAPSLGEQRAYRRADDTRLVTGRDADGDSGQSLRGGRCLRARGRSKPRKRQRVEDGDGRDAGQRQRRRQRHQGERHSSLLTAGRRSSGWRRSARYL